MSRSVVILCVVVAAIVVWLWFTRTRSAPAPIATPTAESHPSPATTGAASPTPLRFRLAGVAASGDDSYAVLEDPDGTTALYRAGDNVSGLGRIAGIDPQEVLIDADNGPLTLRLQPAPSPSAGSTASRVPSGPPASPSPSSPGGSAQGSPTAVAPDQPVS